MHFSWTKPNTLTNRLDVNHYAPQFTDAAEQLNRSQLILVKLNSAINKTSPITYGILQPREFIEDGAYMTRATDLGCPFIDIMRVKQVPLDVEAPYRRSRLQENDLLFSIVGTLGLIGIWKDTGRISNINQSVARVRLGAEYDPYYVAAFFMSNIGQLFLKRWEVGSVQPRINIEDLREISFPHISLAIQRAIGNKIRKAERLIEYEQALLRSTAEDVEWLIGGSLDEGQLLEHGKVLEQYIRAVNDEAERLKPGEPEIWLAELVEPILGRSCSGSNGHVMAMMQQDEQIRFTGNKVAVNGYYTFLRPNSIDANRLDCDFYAPVFLENERRLQQSYHACSTLRSIALALSDGTHETIEKLGGYRKTGYRLITSGEVANGFDSSGICISDEAHRRNKRSEVLPGDLLIAVRGSSSIGISSIYPNNEPVANINTAVVRIRLSPEVDPYWVKIFLNSYVGRMSTLRVANGVNQLNMNMEEVGAIRILLPPLSVQHAIGNKARACEHIRTEVRALIEEVKQAIEALIDKKLNEDFLLSEDEKQKTWLDANAPASKH